MRKRQTFLLTVITSDDDSASLCGRIKVIASGKSRAFSNMSELYDLIASEMDQEILHNLPSADLHESSTEDNFLSS